MKRYRSIVLAALMLAGCGTEANITEVGNPVETETPTAIAAADGATSAVNKTVIGILPGGETGHALSKAEFSSEEFSGQEMEFTCTFNETNNTGECACRGGGTIRHAFQRDLTEGRVGTTFSFNDSFSTTFDRCTVTACGGDFEMTGTMLGSNTGTFDTAIGRGSLVVEQRTAESCSGMEAGGLAFGISVTITYQDENEQYQGTFCTDGLVRSFASLEELHSLLDPTTTCR